MYHGRCGLLLSPELNLIASAIFLFYHLQWEVDGKSRRVLNDKHSSASSTATSSAKFTLKHHHFRTHCRLNITPRLNMTTRSSSILFFRLFTNHMNHCDELVAAFWKINDIVEYIDNFIPWAQSWYSVYPIDLHDAILGSKQLVGSQSQISRYKREIKASEDVGSDHHSWESITESKDLPENSGWSSRGW